MKQLQLHPHSIDPTRQIVEITEDGSLLGTITQAPDGTIRILSKHRLTVTALPDDPRVRTGDGLVIHAVEVRIDKEAAP